MGQQTTGGSLSIPSKTEGANALWHKTPDVAARRKQYGVLSTHRGVILQKPRAIYCQPTSIGEVTNGPFQHWGVLAKPRDSSLLRRAHSSSLPVTRYIIISTSTCTCMLEHSCQHVCMQTVEIEKLCTVQVGVPLKCKHAAAAKCINTCTCVLQH
jgi:hypothetical protein